MVSCLDGFLPGLIEQLAGDFRDCLDQQFKRTTGVAAIDTIVDTCLDLMIIKAPASRALFMLMLESIGPLKESRAELATCNANFGELIARVLREGGRGGGGSYPDAVHAPLLDLRPRNLHNIAHGLEVRAQQGLELIRRHDREFRPDLA